MSPRVRREPRSINVHTKNPIEVLPGKGTLLGTPNREPQEYSKHIIGIYLPGSSYSIIFLLYSWGSLFGVPSRVPLPGNIWGYIGVYPVLGYTYLEVQCTYNLLGNCSSNLNIRPLTTVTLDIIGL